MAGNVCYTKIAPYLSPVPAQVRGVLAGSPGRMERSMVTERADGEVYGGNLLYGAMIAGTVFVMLAALWAPAPAPAQAAQSASQIEEVVVVAHPGRVS